MRHDERHDLFVEYINELNAFLTEPITPEEIEEQFKQQNTGLNIIWQDIFCENKLIGFIIFGVNQMCHPDTDYFIINTFVKKEYRRKHIMSDAIARFLAEHPGKYSLDIIKSNHTAKLFWEHTFRNHGYMPMPLRDVPHGVGPDVLTYGWKPKNKERTTTS